MESGLVDKIGKKKNYTECDSQKLVEGKISGKIEKSEIRKIIANDANAINRLNVTNNGEKHARHF